VNEQERAAQIELAAKGDEDALQRLIVEYNEPLRATVAKGIDPATRRRLDPDDVLQEVYVAAFKSIQACGFDTPAHFYKWLEAIAANELKNRQRALRTQKRDVAREAHGSYLATSSYPDLVGRLAGSGSTPSRRVARGEATAAVLSSLARLSDDQRDVIRLRFLEGKPVAEVAVLIDRTEGAVQGLCRRGLRTLRMSLVSISRFLTRC
jgi:RNA polymerase sigma-70 factor (ECF subfamily)